MSGEQLDNHIDVKNILVDMGIYFQVQVIFIKQKENLIWFSHIFMGVWDINCWI